MRRVGLHGRPKDAPALVFGWNVGVVVVVVVVGGVEADAEQLPLMQTLAVVAAVVARAIADKGKDVARRPPSCVVADYTAAAAVAALVLLVLPNPQLVAPRMRAVAWAIICC